MEYGAIEVGDVAAGASLEEDELAVVARKRLGGADVGGDYVI